MTETAIPAAPQSGPSGKFNAQVAAGTALALVAAGAALALAAAAVALRPERGPSVITPKDDSGARLGVNQRMDELTELGTHEARFGIYSFVNPDTRQVGVLEVLGPADKRGCQDLILSGGGMTTGTTKGLPQGSPFKYCPTR